MKYKSQTVSVALNIAFWAHVEGILCWAVRSDAGITDIDLSQPWMDLVLSESHNQPW